MSWFGKRNDRTEHQYVEEQLSAYLDDELSSRERRRVERHLATCRRCQWSLETLRKTVHWTMEMPTVPVPRNFTVPVRPAVVPRAQRTRRTERTERRWVAPLLQGATAVAAVLFLFSVLGEFLLSGLLPGARNQALHQTTSAPALPTKAAFLSAPTSATEPQIGLGGSAPQAEGTSIPETGPTCGTSDSGQGACPVPTSLAASSGSPAAPGAYAPAPNETASPVPSVAPTVPQVAVSAPTVTSAAPYVAASAPSATAAPGTATLTSEEATRAASAPPGAGVGVEIANAPTETPTATPTTPMVGAIGPTPKARATARPSSSPTAIPTETVPPADTAVEQALATPEVVTATGIVTETVMVSSVVISATETAVPEVAQAAAPVQGQAQAAQEQAGATGALRQSIAGWLGTAAIAFGAAFVVLGAATLAILIRRLTGR